MLSTISVLHETKSVVPGFHAASPSTSPYKPYTTSTASSYNKDTGYTGYPTEADRSSNWRRSSQPIVELGFGNQLIEKLGFESKLIEGLVLEASQKSHVFKTTSIKAKFTIFIRSVFFVIYQMKRKLIEGSVVQMDNLFVTL